MHMLKIPRRHFLHLAAGAEALGALQKADIGKWWPIIKAVGIRAE
jgi:hypothetical protein